MPRSSCAARRGRGARTLAPALRGASGGVSPRARPRELGRWAAVRSRGAGSPCSRLPGVGAKVVIARGKKKKLRAAAEEASAAEASTSQASEASASWARELSDAGVDGEGSTASQAEGSVAAEEGRAKKKPPRVHTSRSHLNFTPLKSFLEASRVAASVGLRLSRPAVRHVQRRTQNMLAAIRAAVAAESALWHRARAGLVTPLVVSQRLLVVSLLLVAVKEAAAGDAPARPFRVFTPASTRAVLVGLVLPNFVFALLDRLLGADAWERLGPLTTKPLMEHERERVASFVRYPMNAHSSHAHCAAGAYILVRGLDARAPHASALLGASTVAMGLASFVWWSSKRLAAQKLDNFLMEVYTAVMGVVGLALVDPRFERHRVSAAVALIVLRGLAFPGHARLGASLAASTFGCVYAVLQLRGAGSPWWHLAGIVLSSQSLVLKMVDTNGFGAWGTAGFHYVAAAAGPVLWIWLQTLPASVVDNPS